jgi:hypothetical protein
MQLKSFGCSFIFGTDLADDGRELIVPTASNFSWPALFAKHHGYNYESLARPGSGNLQIAERVLSHLAQHEPCFYIIGWTWIDRFDYTNSNITNDPILSRWNNWRTLMPIDTNGLAETYYKGLHSEFRDKLTNLMYIKLTIDSLKQKNIPFLMVYMDDLLFDTQYNVTPAVLALQEYVKPYMTTFEQQTFLQWSKQKGFEISSTLHPLEEAHQAAAEYMIKTFDTQKTSDPIR